MQKGNLNAKNGAEKDKTASFFAYGPAADPDVITAITGRKPLDSRPAILSGFVLCIQGVNDIPDLKIPGLPQTARQIIRESWGADFKMYVIRKGDGKVKGVVYTIRKEDMGAMEDWELVNFKWYSVMNGNATFDDGSTREVIAVAIKDQSIEKEVDGLDYDLFLGLGEAFKQLFIKHVNAARRLYLKRESIRSDSNWVVHVQN